MPISAIPRTRRAQLSAKLEDSYGGVPVGDDLFLGMKPTFKLNAEQNEDESIRASFGKPPTIVGGISADMGYSVYAKGSGVATGQSPEYGPALQMCGLKEVIVDDTPGPMSVTYTPDTSQNSPGTATWNLDGKYLAICSGAFGNLKISGESGKLVMLEFAFKGAYTTMVASPLVTTGITYDTTTPRPLRGATVSTQGVSGVYVKSFSIDLGANISLVDDMAAASAYAGAFYGDRNIVGQVVLAAPALATLDAFANTLASTQGAFSWSWGATGNITAISVGYGIIKNPNISDENGKGMLTLEIQAALPAGAAEGADLSLIFANA